MPNISVQNDQRRNGIFLQDAAMLGLLLSGYFPNGSIFPSR